VGGGDHHVVPRRLPAGGHGQARVHGDLHQVAAEHGRARQLGPWEAHRPDGVASSVRRELGAIGAKLVELYGA